MTKWEYKHVRADQEDDLEHYEIRRGYAVDRLDALGEDGWELVSVVVQDGKTHYIFKRPKE